ncbi:MAG TPA: DEAD/DEAH box helicase [Burkholderiaceae bacterium]|nr:DEAD/DEAH box helicase [Burkholderiaceae bacterium]
MSFANLGLSDALVRAVADAGYTQPTPIQSQAIPVVLSGADLLAGAQTGTGKTAAFVLPVLHMLDTPASGAQRSARKVRCLVLTPTRELAAQVEESVRTYGRHSNLSSCTVFGGVSIRPQIDRLRRGVDVLVATPGRLLDHCAQRTIDLSGVQILVLDEADRMLDMGFLPDIKRILAILPKRRQNLLFSATFSDPIRALADSLLNAPKHIQVTPRNSTVDAVTQTVHPVDAARKADLLVHLVQQGSWFQVLVFTRTKHGANKLAARLEKSQVPAQAIHGNKSQNARTRALADFKSGKLQVLVATDIAARGLDIDQLPHVVNFELPHVPEDYVHRIGRTGRAGANGEAISLVSAEENGRLRDIERLIRRSIARAVVPGFEPGRANSTAPARVASDDLRSSSRSTGQAPRPDVARAGGPRDPARRRLEQAGGGRAHSAHPQARELRAPGRATSSRAQAVQGERRVSPVSLATGDKTAKGRTRPALPAGSTALVRSNLPAGWAQGAQPRRGR